MRQNEFDPLAYIENAFLDRKKREVVPESDDLSVAIPSISDYINSNGKDGVAPSTGSATATMSPASATAVLLEPEIKIEPEVQKSIKDSIPVDLDLTGRRTRFKKTLMSAPRPRRAKAQTTASGATIDPELQSCWETLPRSIEFLCGFYDDSVTANYYRGEFKESRNDLIKRLLDPELSLEETSRLLGVCPATVRRYTNREWLTHHRTSGGQRRFRLSDIVRFVEVHGRFPEE